MVFIHLSEASPYPLIFVYLYIIDDPLPGALYRGCSLNACWNEVTQSERTFETRYSGHSAASQALGQRGEEHWSTLEKHSTEILAFWDFEFKPMIAWLRQTEGGEYSYDISSLGRAFSVNCCKMYKLSGGLVPFSFFLEKLSSFWKGCSFTPTISVKTHMERQKGSMKLTRQINLGGKLSSHWTVSHLLGKKTNLYLGSYKKTKPRDNSKKQKTKTLIQTVLLFSFAEVLARTSSLEENYLIGIIVTRFILLNEIAKN